MLFTFKSAMQRKQTQSCKHAVHLNLIPFCLFIFLCFFGLDRKLKHCNIETKAIFTVYLAWPRLRGNTNIVEKPEQAGFFPKIDEMNPHNHLNTCGFSKTEH